MKRPQIKRLVVIRCLLIVGAIAITILAGECTVRIIGDVDAEGNFRFRGRLVGRRFPPVFSVTETLAKYQTSDTSRMIYDEATGWKPRPHGNTHAGNYRYNSAGIRSQPTEYSLTPAAGTLRIALFGDSFTHGDDVPFEQTWGALLERNLNDAGIKSEVINFGVSAYAMDQAYLRWKMLGHKYSPDVVLFGFQAENVNRNVNMLRAFYAAGSGIPFSKPRFILSAAGKLRLINSPTLSLETVPRVMSDMDSWTLAEYESFYDPSIFQRRFWHGSRLLSLTVDSMSDGPNSRPVRRENPFRLDSEPARVTLALLSEFGRDVERHQAEFLIVHLPKQSDLARILRGRACAYQALLDRISTEQTVIDPQPKLLAAARADSLELLFQRHYSMAGNRIIADVISRFFVDHGITAHREEATGRPNPDDPP